MASLNHQKNLTTSPSGRAGVDSFVLAAVAALQDDVKVIDLLPQTGIAFNTLSRNFKAKHGITPMHWLWVLRAFAAAGILAEIPGSNITAIAFHCGFSSSSHFTRKFSSVFQATPSELRQLCRNKELDRSAKRSLIVSLVKKRYHNCVPLIVDSISQNTSIVSIFNLPESSSMLRHYDNPAKCCLCNIDLLPKMP